MHMKIAQAVRHLVTLLDHQTARTNAAEASDTLRLRRQDQERVDEYLQGLLMAAESDPAPHEIEN